MAKKIIEMVLAKRDAMRPVDGESPEERQKKFDAAEKVAQLAVAAINGGVESRAWETYMRQFIETDANGTPLDPAQFSRLLADDGTLGDTEMDRKRGYLLSNGMCGSGSPFTGGLDRSVDTIDGGLGGVVCKDDGKRPANLGTKRAR
jgi:hypothetical protein